MRVLFATLAALAAVSFGPAASAEPVRLAPIVVSDRLQEKFVEELGEREAPVLLDYVRDQVAHALEREGAQIAESGPVTVEITLVDAVESKPTFQQMQKNLGLDYFSSVSLGGAELQAVLRAADGHVLAQIDHRHSAWSLDDISLAGTWGDARRSIRLFAGKVGRAYRQEVAGA